MTEAIEIVRFRLKPGVTEAAFRAAADQTDKAMSRFPGFVRRDLSHDGSGTWIDYVLWENMAAAEDAAKSFHTLPETQDFCGMIDMEQASMSHLGLVRSWRKAA